DRNVTGVQTCALPIYRGLGDADPQGADRAEAEELFAPIGGEAAPMRTTLFPADDMAGEVVVRSPHAALRSLPQAALSDGCGDHEVGRASGREGAAIAG